MQLEEFLPLNDDRLEHKISEIHGRIESPNAKGDKYSDLIFKIGGTPLNGQGAGSKDNGHDEKRRIFKLAKSSQQLRREHSPQSPQYLQYPFIKGRDLTQGENHLLRHEKMIRAQELNKNMVTKHLLTNQKYGMISHEELKPSLMDRSSNFRLKVEDLNFVQFDSS